MPTRARLVAIAGCVVCFVFLSAFACSNEKSGQTTVTIQNGAYHPDKLTVAMGTLVTFINNDAQPHTVTSVGAFDSGPIAPNGGRWTYVAHTAGTFSYHSLMQPDMKGTLSITPATPTSY
jgi:plastocyanin